MKTRLLGEPLPAYPRYTLPPLTSIIQVYLKSASTSYNVKMQQLCKTALKSQFLPLQPHGHGQGSRDGQGAEVGQGGQSSENDHYDQVKQQEALEDLSTQLKPLLGDSGMMDSNLVGSLVPR